MAHFAIEAQAVFVRGAKASVELVRGCSVGYADDGKASHVLFERVHVDVLCGC